MILGKSTPRAIIHILPIDKIAIAHIKQIISSQQTLIAPSMTTTTLLALSYFTGSIISRTSTRGAATISLHPEREASATTNSVSLAPTLCVMRIIMSSDCIRNSNDSCIHNSIFSDARIKTWQRRFSVSMSLSCVSV